MAVNLVLIHPDDNVAVATEEIKSGAKAESAEGLVITARSDVPRNHKMALDDIPAGGAVIKYGERIGDAGEDIAKGDWIHTHNLKTGGV